ncbi:MAG: NAD(P)-dependent oxidoreductase [Myxococcota bacterium]
MKVVVADKISRGPVQALKEIAREVVFEPLLKGEALADACEDAEVLVVRSTKVPAMVFERAPKLALVVRAGAGVNTIDVPEAARRGIFVANCPGRNADAVAELAIGLMVALDRRIPDNVAAFRQGRWNKKGFSQAQGLAGRTVGVVGLGRIGYGFLQRARAFGMKPLAWSRSLTEERAHELGIRRADSIEEVLQRSDVVSLHLAQTPHTENLFDAEMLSHVRPQAIFINTSRAGIVDEDALLRIVEDRGVRVGLDVFDDEPSGKEGEVTTPLQQHRNVYVTHHIGASTEQAQQAVAAEVVRIIQTFADTGRVPNSVNLCERTPATHQVAVRHADQVGVLAGVLAEISRHGLNVEELQNIVFDGAEAACCYIQLAAEPPAALLDALQSQEHVHGVSSQRIG